MASKTTNYGLNKHSPQDFYNVEARNENWDKIDTELKNNVDAVNARVKTAELAAEVKKVVKDGSLTAADLGAEKAGAAAALAKKVDALGAGDVGADPTGTAANAVSTHNTSTSAHSAQFAKKQDKIKGKKGKYLGFTANDTVGEVDAPASGGSRITLTFASDFVGQVWTLKGGGETYTGTVDSSKTATVSVLGINTTYTLSAALSGTTYTAEVTTKDYYTALAVTLKPINVFGVMWDTSNSSTALTRLKPSTDPYGLVTRSVATEPKPAVGTGSGSSPFDSYAPWSGMVKTTINRNIMVFIPEFYVAYKESGTKKYFYVSDKPETGMTKHPGSGKYVGRYHMNGNGQSVSGSDPYLRITRATARSKAKSLGSKYHLYDFATYCAIIFLYIVEFADWNCQSKIGRGIVDSSGMAISSGLTDSMIYHTGRDSGTDGYTLVQYRWIENLWGNVYQYVDGFNANGTTAYYCTDPSKYADDTATGYTKIGTLPASGYIKDLIVTDNGLLIPKTTGGSETTYIPDYMSSSSGWCVLAVGGYWSKPSGAGLFCFDADRGSSYSGSFFSARLLCEA